jgi:hypothetical protein
LYFRYIFAWLDKIFCFYKLNAFLRFSLNKIIQLIFLTSTGCFTLEIIIQVWFRNIKDTFIIPYVFRRVIYPFLYLLCISVILSLNKRILKNEIIYRKIRNIIFYRKILCLGMPNTPSFIVSRVYLLWSISLILSWLRFLLLFWDLPIDGFFLSLGKYISELFIT